MFTSFTTKNLNRRPSEPGIAYVLRLAAILFASFLVVAVVCAWLLDWWVLINGLVCVINNILEWVVGGPHL